MTADQIKKEIDRLYANTDVSIDTTKADLKDLLEHIEIMLEAL